MDGPEVAIRWDGEREPRRLPQAAEADIELAYAITCHRAQGSGSHAVVIVVEYHAWLRGSGSIRRLLGHESWSLWWVIISL